MAGVIRPLRTRSPLLTKTDAVAPNTHVALTRGEEKASA